MSLTNSRPANVKNPNAAPGPGTWSLSAYETQACLFLIPFFLGSLILIVLPALITLGVAFTKYNAIQPPTWVGLNNFRALLASPLARLSLRISLQFIFLVQNVVTALVVGCACSALCCWRSCCNKAVACSADCAQRSFCRLSSPKAHTR